MALLKQRGRQTLVRDGLVRSLRHPFSNPRTHNMAESGPVTIRRPVFAHFYFCGNY